MPTLCDANGQNWKLVLEQSDADQRLSLVPTSVPGESSLLLADFLREGQQFLLTVVDEQLQASETVSDQPARAYLEILQPDGSIVHVGLTRSGQMFTVLAKLAQGTPFLAGYLYPGNGAYPAAQQPGGPGTRVTFPQTPIQPNPNRLPEAVSGQPYEMTGKWIAGCGTHMFNHFDFKRVFFDGAALCLICCPVCGFIEKAIPYDQMHSENQMAIFS